MRIATTPRGFLYVLDKRVAINPRAYIGRSRDAHLEHGKYRWKAIFNLWITTLLAEGLLSITFDQVTNRVRFQGVLVNCSDYDQEAGVLEFGYFCWETIMKIWFLGLNKRRLLTFRAYPIPDVLADGFPVGYVKHAMSNASKFNNPDSWGGIAHTVWAEGIGPLYGFDVMSLMRITYDGSTVCFKTINDATYMLTMGPRVIILESSYALFYSTLKNIAALSSLYFMNDKTLVNPLREATRFNADCSPELLKILSSAANTVKGLLASYWQQLSSVLNELFPDVLSNIVADYI